MFLPIQAGVTITGQIWNLQPTTYSKRQAVNTLYAIHGLTFSNKKIQNYFNDQDWYVGDPNLSFKDIRLNKSEIDILKTLKSEREKSGLR
ncbi:MAG: YARHG domain-containing protein [Ignavibacteria bacterium]|nr:YARHG domain-containing protein [Ignavibacteria bacterium]